MICPHCGMDDNEPVTRPMTKEEAWKLALEWAESVDAKMMARGCVIVHDELGPIKSNAGGQQ